ncbi:MAG: penicillin-binding protein 2 [Patescibacteria group bacterium]|nr:penicillin-binding protein 2 [Patescibacteria group bacterium]
MAHDPFTIKEQGADIRDSGIAAFRYEVDGDVVIADSYRKRATGSWKNKRASRMLGIAVFLVFGVLLGKLYYLQVVRGAEYYGTAEGNRIRSIPVIPARGVIFDHEQRRLAYNVPDFALFVVPADLPETQEQEDVIFKKLEQILGVSHFDLVERFSHVPRTSTEPVEIMRGMGRDQAIALASETGLFGGVFVSGSQQREYAFDAELAHVLGYTGSISAEEYRGYVEERGYALIEHVGKMGIEKTYQESLRGVPGRELLEVDSAGSATRVLEKTEPWAGDNLYLHLDAGLQQIAWDALRDMALLRQSPGGTVVALDPRNGAVRALVSYPSFSGQAFSRGIGAAEYQSLISDSSKPLFNRATSGEYPSGSTIKLVVGAAALEEGLVSRNTSITSSGGIQVGIYRYPDWRYGGHGETNIIHALADSVNTYFYAIGGGYADIEGLGIERIARYGEAFGLNAPTGIDLPAEQSGFLPSKEWKEEVKGERWYLGDTYHAAIGQGDILVTPLQVANFTAAIANGGTVYSPRIVDRVGRTYESARSVEPRVLQAHAASPGSIRIIQEGLRAAVTYGTARSLLSLPVSSAGKTGTAQFSTG